MARRCARHAKGAVKVRPRAQSANSAGTKNVSASCGSEGGDERGEADEEGARPENGTFDLSSAVGAHARVVHLPHLRLLRCG